MFTSFFLNNLNRRAASSQSQPQRIIENLGIQPGYMLADIGSGGGYFTLEFARRVGESGLVFAVDTEADHLNFVERAVQRAGLKNVVPTLAADRLILPESGLDLVFMRNVFHHLPEPNAYFRDLRRFLKPGGRIAIIDYTRPRSISFLGMFGHYTPVETINETMRTAGYTPRESFNFLPTQSFQVFAA